MYLIKSTYIGKAKTKKWVFWGRIGKHYVCNINEKPDKDWVFKNCLDQNATIPKKLKAIPERLYFDETEYILMTNEVIDYRNRRV